MDELEHLSELSFKYLKGDLIRIIDMYCTFVKKTKKRNLISFELEFIKNKCND